MLHRVQGDVMTLRTLHASVKVLDLDEMAERPITRLEAVKTFLPEGVLEKLAAVATVVYVCEASGLLLRMRLWTHCASCTLCKLR